VGESGRAGGSPTRLLRGSWISGDVMVLRHGRWSGLGVRGRPDQGHCTARGGGHPRAFRKDNWMDVYEIRTGRGFSDCGRGGYDEWVQVRKRIRLDNIFTTSASIFFSHVERSGYYTDADFFGCQI
jgi:hypothetical protein